jgi:hypothetical protein
MNKKEIRSAINKAVYIYAESLGYDMYDDNDGSYVTFMKTRGKYDDAIDYSRSHHTTSVLNWAHHEIKADAEKIEEYAKQQRNIYEKQN